jgi:hypothetical protein
MHKELFSSITFGALQSYGSVAALPVSTPVNPSGLSYLTLSEAVSLTLIRIEEVNAGGSVPELRVMSSAAIPVLIISGEEVKGAKQNRILNTSILVPAKGELIIPVSCTERGRWSYSSPGFKDSGNLSSKDVRKAASDSVSHSLVEGRGHHSDQIKVWDKIEELHFKSNSDGISHTRAMDDAFKARKTDLEEAQRHFSLIPGQTGILFFHSGKVAGLDILSRPAAYARLHDKLVKSYVIDCLQTKKTKKEPDTLVREADHFLKQAMNGNVKTYKSPGLGEDFRLNAPSIQGSSLVYEGEALHTCCFSLEAEEERMAGFKSRRNL